MLQVFQSNRMEVLVTILAEQIKRPVSDNVFSPDTVMVQSPGMSQWLKLQLAQQNSIAANIDFPLPSSFIWKLYQGLLTGVPEESPFNKDRLTWRLYQLLPQYLSQDEFSAIEQYLSTSKSTSQSEQIANQALSFEQLRQFQLAEKIADVFDNYLMYRQHWLEHWVAGNNDLPEDGFDDEIKGQEWQAILWRAVVADIEASYQNNDEENPLSRAQMHSLLLSALDKLDAKTLKALLPSRLFIFGISTLPQHQLEILDALSRHIDVQILWLNPCALFWGDILSDKTLARIASKNPEQADLAKLNSEQKQNYFIVGNPVLANLGKVGRDYLDNLTQIEVEFHDVFIDQAPSNVLQHVQQDILQLEFRGEQQPLTPEQLRSDFGKKIRNKSDDSIQIHNCHSRIRELEVLRDKLLSWFEQDSELLPKDILVMMPDVDLYAPFIDSVFAFNKHKPNEFIPFTIADRAGLVEEPILHTFTGLLALPNSRFNVSELLDHLEVPAIMDKFDLSQVDVNLIKQWLMDCQIKWAKDAEHKANWGLPEIELNSWIYGLKRMLLGLALDGSKVWHDILSYQHIEGLNGVILGKLLDYFSFVHYLEQSLQGNKSLEHWHELIQQLTDYLFIPKDENGSSNNKARLSERELLMVQKIKDANERLLKYQGNGDFSEQIGCRIVQQFFTQELNQTGVTQRFLAGSMNFCTLMPMRSVPFKVVSVLGLNEGDYPRQVDPISFDLVGLNTARKGDRSRKLDDRYLFLEALVSARDKLHLSYLGQSVKDNQALMPSVILSELQDYLQQSFILDSEQVSTLFIQHKLQPFNPAYFELGNEKTSYKSFDESWFKLASGVRDTLSDTDNSAKESATVDREARSQKQTSHIDFNDFILFWQHPIKHFYKQVLGVKLELNDDKIEDFEVFSHDGLNKYKMLDDMLNAKLNHKTVSETSLLLSGAFPYENWGESLVKQYEKQSDGILASITNFFNGLPEFTPINLTYQHQASCLLTGNLQLVKQGNLYHSVDTRAGEIRAQDKLTMYLSHLFKCASGFTGYSLFFDNKGKMYWLEPLALEQAQELLTPWLVQYRHNGNDLFKWHIALAAKWLEGQEKGLSDNLMEQTIMSELTVNPFKRNLGSDEYCLKTLRSISDLDSTFYDFSQSVMPAMFELLQVQSGKKVPDIDLTGGQG